MFLLQIRLPAGALACAFIAVGTAAAHAHAVCGDRVFPSTQAIDDPGVTDELTLPALTWLPKNSDGVQELDAGVEWAKTIFPNFAVSVGVGRNVAAPRRLWLGLSGDRSEIPVHVHSPT